MQNENEKTISYNQLFDFLKRDTVETVLDMSPRARKQFAKLCQERIDELEQPTSKKQILKNTFDLDNVLFWISFLMLFGTFMFVFESLIPESMLKPLGLGINIAYSIAEFLLSALISLAILFTTMTFQTKLNRANEIKFRKTLIAYFEAYPEYDLDEPLMHYSFWHAEKDALDLAVGTKLPTALNRNEDEELGDENEN